MDKDLAVNNLTKKSANVLISLLIMLLCIQPALAWGGLTHYSINRDANNDSVDELSAAVAPDALQDLNYGFNDLDVFVHQELPGVLYGPLDVSLYNVSNGPSQELWARGWMTHTTADRTSHGTYLTGSAYQDPQNYLSAAGASDTLLAHIEAEFGGDILSYWFHQGTIPEEFVVYPDQIGEAFVDYAVYGTNYSEEYDSSQYLEAYESLQAAILTEQKIIDARQDKKPQFSDWAFLIWAYYSYNEPYNIYYNFAVDNVTSATFSSSLLPSGSALSQNTLFSSVSVDKMKKHSAEYVEIKMEIGAKLIDDGLIVPHKNTKNGAVVIDFEQTVSDKELAKAYEQCLEESYQKHTGKKVKILDEIKSKRKNISIRDVEKDYPDLYQKLIENGIIEKDKIDNKQKNKT